MSRNTEDNAREFRKDDVPPLRRGILTACSIDVDLRPIADGKVAAVAFAALSNRPVGEVVRYFRAWEYLATFNLVPEARTLVPADADRMVIDRKEVQARYEDAFISQPWLMSGAGRRA